MNWRPCIQIDPVVYMGFIHDNLMSNVTDYLHGNEMYRNLWPNRTICLHGIMDLFVCMKLEYI